MLAGLDAFDATVKGWLKDVEKEAAEAAVGLAHEAFDHIIENAAQSSGDFVANTNVSMNGKPDYSFTPSLTPVSHRVLSTADLFKKGDPQAQEEAKKRAVWSVPKLGVPIFIASNAVHDEPYSVDLEKGRINLRPVNQGGDHAYANALSYVQHRYAHIGKAQLVSLKGKAK